MELILFFIFLNYMLTFFATFYTKVYVKMYEETDSLIKNRFFYYLRPKNLLQTLRMPFRPGLP